MTGRSLLVRGGTVVDGTNATPFTADILVRGDHISDVGHFDSVDDADILDATGYVVSPGFIDIHSHSDFTLIVDPRAISSITQGVTTEVIGNCGYGCALVANPVLAPAAIYGFRADYPISWSRVGGYLAQLEQASPAVNVVTLVPNGQLRLATVGLSAKPAGSGELKAMTELLQEGLEEGAFGYSTGLEYPTEIGASEDEVTELCRVVARRGGFYATHTRNRDSGAVAAVSEALRTAKRAGVRLQISHITPRTGQRATESIIDLVDRARDRGADVGFDMHTRLFGITHLKAILPPPILAGHPTEVATRLRDPSVRAEMKRFPNIVSSFGDWSRVILFDDIGLPDVSRHSMADIAAGMGKEPLECAYDLLLAESDEIQRPMVLLLSYSEDLLRFTYRHAACCIGSDATALAPDGPLANSSFHGAYSWASWFFRRMVRESKTFTCEEAIHKLTGLPAATIGVTDRGVIRKGHRADIVVFDPGVFGDRATMFEPNQVAVGMVHVIVNGVVAMRDGALTGERGGRVLRSRDAGS